MKIQNIIAIIQLKTERTDFIWKKKDAFYVINLITINIQCLEEDVFGKEPEDLTIEDKITDNLLIKSTVFNETIKSLIEKYGKETGKFDLKDYERNGVLLKFEGGDLLYSLHNATMFVNAIKNENSTWKLDGNIIDTYDFTEFKDLKEYVDKKESMLTDIFSTLLNNFGVVSSEYGVIKKI